MDQNSTMLAGLDEKSWGAWYPRAGTGKPLSVFPGRYDDSRRGRTRRLPPRRQTRGPAARRVPPEVQPEHCSAPRVRSALRRKLEIRIPRAVRISIADRRPEKG